MLQRLARRMIDSLCRFGRADEGVTAIEFVMVAPPVIYIMGIILEVGAMTFTQYAIQAGVIDASRLARTGQAQTGGLTAAAFKDKICATANVLIDCTGSVSVYVRSDGDFSTLKANTPPVLQIGPSFSILVTPPVSYNPGPPAQPAVVIATYDWYFVMYGMRWFGNVNGNAARRLHGIATFLNEPYK